MPGSQGRRRPRLLPEKIVLQQLRLAAEDSRLASEDRWVFDKADEGPVLEQHELVGPSLCRPDLFEFAPNPLQQSGIEYVPGAEATAFYEEYSFSCSHRLHALMDKTSFFASVRARSRQAPYQ